MAAPAWRLLLFLPLLLLIPLALALIHKRTNTRSAGEAANVERAPVDDGQKKRKPVRSTLARRCEGARARARALSLSLSLSLALSLSLSLSLSV